jgi:rhodanese-related sulfurtransferase
MNAMPIKNISPQELKTKLDSGEDFELIDVREQNEKDVADIGGKLIPLKTIVARVDEIPRNKTVVIYCRSGGRSSKAVDLPTLLIFKAVFWVGRIRSIHR